MPAPRPCRPLRPPGGRALPEDRDGTRASAPDRAEPAQDPKDARASPLGRGANPGTSVEGGPIEATGIAGLHGANVPGERGGPDGMISRENEDSVPAARRDAAKLPR